MARLVPLRSFPPLVLFQRSLVTFLVLTLSIAGYPAEAIAAQDQAPAQNQAPVDTSPANLDHLLAPIALYPDALLMQVLAASVNTQEVLDAGNWLLENKSVQGTAIDAAAKKLGFSAATTALLHFPDVVDQMCTQIDWTGDVGQAFNADQAGVLASIQRLRAQAQQAGTLKTSSQQTVETQTDNGKQVIVIQPANPQVVYVPQYNPQTVYVAPPPGPSTGDVVAASVISFGVGMAVGAIFANNNNYCYPRWGYGGVYYGGHPYVRPPYRPVYPGYRPAYGYRPPANYPYHGGNRYNNNYYNSYKGGNNYRGGNNSYRGGGNTVNNVNVNVNKNNNNNRPNNGNGNGYNKPGNNNNNNNRPGNNGNNGGYNKPGNGNNNNAGNRPGNNNSGNRSATTNVSRPAPDRGYSKPAGASAQTRPSGGGAQARPQQPQARPAPTKQASAFGGGGSSGRSTQAASQRGAASNAGRANGGGRKK